MQDNRITTEETDTTLLRRGRARVGAIRLCYEDFGSLDDPVILLIMGLGTQMLGWQDRFCEQLVDKGFRVIRFDNRDIGLSGKIAIRGRHDSVRKAYLKSLLGIRIKAPYLLYDMAADTVGLLDELQIRQAHVVGASMGGMIAQIIAAQYPQRVTSLTSIMSTSGHGKLKRGKLRALLRLIKRPPSNELDVVTDHMATTMEMIGSREGLRQTHEQWYAQIRRGIERSYYPAGTARQLLAVLASGSRVSLLRQVDLPALVIHGEIDPLVPVEHGRHTAECLRHAQLEVIEGMGHDLPPALFPRLVGLISAHARKAQAWTPALTR